MGMEEMRQLNLRQCTEESRFKEKVWRDQGTPHAALRALDNRLLFLLTKGYHES